MYALKFFLLLLIAVVVGVSAQPRFPRVRIGPKFNFTNIAKDLEDLLKSRPIWKPGQRRLSMAFSTPSNGIIRGRNVLDKKYCTCVTAARSRIVGGKISTVSYPWMVFVDLDGGSCGGFIINSRQVITAAHCTEDRIPSQILVFAGVNDLNTITSANAYRVQYIDDNPLYASNGGNIARPGDFSVLTIDGAKPFDFNNLNIKPACLDYQFRDNYGNTLATGWGLTDRPVYYDQSGDLANNPSTSSMLKEAPFAYIPTTKASESFDPINCAAGHLACIKEIYSTDAVCQGDSGGPLHVAMNGKMVVIGATSFGPGRSVTYNGQDASQFCIGPTAYSRVSYYKNFLETTSGSHNLCWVN